MSKEREFNLAIREAGSGAEIVLRGVISERVTLDTSGVPAGLPLVVDAGGVTNINSLGVRNWIRFLDALCERSPSVVVRRLSPVLVLQASMISTFLSRAHVESFLAPWYCPACEHNTDTEYRFDAHVPESVQCPKCGAAMELDSDRETYLAFRGVLTG